VTGISGVSRSGSGGRWDARANFTLLANKTSANLSGTTVQAIIGGKVTSCRIPSGSKACTTGWLSMNKTLSSAIIQVTGLVFSSGASYSYDSINSMKNATVNK
jgi:hypothetical protein